MDYNDVLVIAIVLAVVSFLLIIIVFIQKIVLVFNSKRNLSIQEKLMHRYVFNSNENIRCTSRAYLKNLFSLSQRIQLSLKSQIQAFDYLNDLKVIPRIFKQLNSRNAFIRKRAISYLSIFPNIQIRDALILRLEIERVEHIKLLLVNALKFHMENQETLKSVIRSLEGSRRVYQKRVVQILKNHITHSKFNLREYFSSPLIEIRETVIELSQYLYHPSFEDPLKIILNEVEEHYIYNNSDILKNCRKPRIDRLYHQTLFALSHFYGMNIGVRKYLGNIDSEVAKIAAESMISSGNIETIKTLMSYASLTSRDVIYSDVIAQICENDKTIYTDLYTLFRTQLENRQKYLLAGVFSKKIDYLLLTLDNDEDLAYLIENMINSHYSVNIINWLNHNKDKEIEKKLINIISPYAKENYDFYLELNNYLDPRIFRKMGHIKTKYLEKSQAIAEPDNGKVKWLRAILIFAIFLIPILFFLVNIRLIFSSSLRDIFYQYIVQINIWFIGYYLFVNFYYLFFALISLFEFRDQKRLWDIKSPDLLYEEGMLSAISIIVPAYNEELTIQESIQSLLSLKYPNFEVIVINDGSKDETLKTIIDAFGLKRVDFIEDKKIPTNHVKAVYKNKFYSKLTLVDKENGGKADALNVGINFSNFDYVCGIDADSIIESDALLKMMSSSLDHDEITLALGGSIVPVNGSVVDHGYVESYSIPDNPLALFQTIEYIRAFNTGRLAFSRIHSLLIISGAFGLFEKRILIEIGGYLSASSFKKRTVGEDMELVVRINRQATESNLRHIIKYTPMARCYTEVPNKAKIFFNQRNRWQRGLIESLSFHRNMLFNPQYGSKGLIGMPYFFIFEMLGPLFEAQVFFTLLLGIILGLFNGVLILLLLVITCFLGIILSMTSLFVQEKYADTLSIKDTLIVILFAIIENLGWRQIMNLYRVWGFILSLKGKHTWGSMTRVGFKK